MHSHRPLAALQGVSAEQVFPAQRFTVMQVLVPASQVSPPVHDVPVHSQAPLAGLQ